MIPAVDAGSTVPSANAFTAAALNDANSLACTSHSDRAYHGMSMTPIPGHRASGL